LDSEVADFYLRIDDYVFFFFPGLERPIPQTEVYEISPRLFLKMSSLTRDVAARVLSPHNQSAQFWFILSTTSFERGYTHALFSDSAAELSLHPVTGVLPLLIH